jgi:cyclophilin family peptidyl-prolyl cis-trans isomerase
MFRSYTALAGKTFAAGSTTRTFLQYAIEKDNTVIKELRLEFELFGKKTPMAVENFAKLCSGEAVLPYQAPMESIGDPGFKDQYAPQLTYKGSFIHRVIPNFIVQGGDISSGFGTEQLSVHGPTFDAPGELGVVKFDRPALIGTAVSSPGENGSQFFILTSPNGAPHLDGTCICFGKVSAGFKELIEVVKTLPLTGEGRPMLNFVCIDCGIL